LLTFCRLKIALFITVALIVIHYEIIKTPPPAKGEETVNLCLSSSPLIMGGSIKLQL
jgi:hypothetical protein